MSTVEIVFSPTGGTQKVADIIAGRWQMPVSTVDLCDAGADFSSVTVSSDDVALIAVPSYGGRVPALAVERLSKVHGSGARCVLVCVYGNRAYEDTLAELYDAAKGCGFEVVAAVAAVAEHSIMHQYAAGRPDADDKAALEDYAFKILSKIQSGDTSAPVIPGNRPYKKSAGTPLYPKGDSKCVSCGICAEKCPAGAIDKANPRETDTKKCISCMRCVSICPQGARKVNYAIVAAAALAIKKACSERKAPELFM